jgi:thiol-disulfide isomerase/thioredoxin
VRLHRIALVGVPLLALLVAACGGDAAEDTAAQPSGVTTGGTSAAGAAPASAPTEAPAHPPAPELIGLTAWLNSEPLTLAGLGEAGRVVLIDFWTYTCVNCIRTLPFLRDWHEKYADRGLTILGVHAPEFQFEHDPANVRDAVARHDLRYPVAQDNEMETWSAFGNRFWPAKYLVGADGALRYQHFGEGEYDSTELAIRAALTDAGHDVSDVPLGGVDPPMLDPGLAGGITRELYGGYARSYTIQGIYAAQEEYYEGPDRTALYEDEPEHRHNQWYVQGLWRNEAEAIVHARRTETPEDYLAFRFVARSVNVVMRPATGEPFEVIVELDGLALLPEEAGPDVTFEAGDGGERRAVVRVDEARMYRMVQLPALGDHELRLRTASDSFAMFAVTFGAYTEGE